MAKTIAIVDDEQKIRDMIKQYLENEGYTTLLAEDGQEAIALVDKNDELDLILLDVMMPNMDGFQTLREIRSVKKKLPVIMLTAKTEELDKLLGLEMGADDYITKPFSMRELAARIKAVLRRSNMENDEEVEETLIRGNIHISLATYEVKVAEQPVNLTPTEYKILVTLAQKPGRVYSRLQLMTSAMGEAYANYERSIDTHVSNLRKKVEKDPANPEYIHTVYGIGYRFGEKK